MTAPARTRRAVAWLRDRTTAGGAGESGLAALIRLCALNAAGDTLVAIGLANTLFFAVPAGEARGKVALYLLTTMAPFALLAPLIGPLLDRFGHGRRLALAATMLARVVVVWQLAHHSSGLAIYPLALGVLVATRAFGVTKSAVVPRVLPPGATLVWANARLSLTGVVVAAVAGPLGLGLHALLGYRWLLLVASALFLPGVLLAMALPDRVDRPEGEEPARGLATATVARSRFRSSLGGVPQALRTAAAIRGAVGFLTFLLAFVLRGQGSGTAALGALAAASGLGTAAGVTLGNRTGKRAPETVLALCLGLAAVACLVGLAAYSVVVAVGIALVVSTAASLGKLCLDSVIQRDIPTAVRASAFARSETALQLAWVVGGALGLIPFNGTIGFGVATALLVTAMVAEVGMRRSVA